MLEVECAFIDSLDTICSLVEDYVKFIIATARNEWLKDAERLDKFLSEGEHYSKVSTL
jgi:aspartyl/asparaginyl-tRNA synthetase